ALLSRRLRPPPRSTLFPYTTLFRSAELDKADLQAQVREAQATLKAEEANLQAAVAAESKARIEAANPDLDFARRDYVRVQGLFRSEEHTSELQSLTNLVCRLLLEKI